MRQVNGEIIAQRTPKGVKKVLLHETLADDVATIGGLARLVCTPKSPLRRRPDPAIIPEIHGFHGKYFKSPTG